MGGYKVDHQQVRDSGLAVTAINMNVKSEARMKSFFRQHLLIHADTFWCSFGADTIKIMEKMDRMDK